MLQMFRDVLFDLVLITLFIAISVIGMYWYLQALGGAR
jgi:hypothetical protein